MSKKKQKTTKMKTRQFSNNRKNMFCGRSQPNEGESTEFIQTFIATPETVNIEERTIEFVSATDRWINRYWWSEKLVVTDEAIDQSRLSKGISFCDSHDHSVVDGITVGYRIEEDTGKLITIVRFSKKQSSDDVFQDYVDGVLRYVSIGYIVLNQTITSYDGEDDRPDEYLVTRWQPIELSKVGVPADEDSSSRDANLINHAKRETKRNKMKDKDKGNTASGGTRDNSQDVAVAEITKEANARADARIADNNDIADMGLRYGMVEEAREHIKSGGNVRTFQSKVMDKIEAESRDNTADTNLDMEDKDVEQYSVFRAVMAHQKGRFRQDAPLEHEASQAVAQALGRDANGFYIPMEVQNDFARRMRVGGMKREMLVSSATNGANLVGVTHRGDQFIDVLFERTLLFKLGARVIDNLTENITIPRGDGGVTHEWVGEATAPTPSHGAIGQIALEYKTIASAVELSRKLLKQGSPSAEAYIIDLILRGSAIAIDTAGFQGAGGLSILGIMNTAGVSSIPLVGAFATHDETIDFETAVDSDNALVDNMAWAVSPNVAGAWKKNLKSAGVAGYISENNEVNGYDVHRKTGLTAGTTLFGDFASYVFGMWGVLDLITDTSTNISEGGIVLRSFQDIDGAVTQTSSFCKNA